MRNPISRSKVTSYRRTTTKVVLWPLHVHARARVCTHTQAQLFVLFLKTHSHYFRVNERQPFWNTAPGSQQATSCESHFRQDHIRQRGLSAEHLASTIPTAAHIFSLSSVHMAQMCVISLQIDPQDLDVWQGCQGVRKEFTGGKLRRSSHLSVNHGSPCTRLSVSGSENGVDRPAGLLRLPIGICRPCKCRAWPPPPQKCMT